MTEADRAQAGASRKARISDEAAARRLRKRYAAERRFQAYGIAAIGAALAALVWLLSTVAMTGLGAFRQHVVALEVTVDADVLGVGVAPDVAALETANFGGLIKQAVRDRFPEVSGRRERRALSALLSNGAAFDLRARVLADPSWIGREGRFELPLSDDVDYFLKHPEERDIPEGERRLSDAQIAWLDELAGEGRVREIFNSRFLTSGDSREPELAGIGGALVGTLLTLGVTLLLSFPLGVAAAVYLEEFAPRTRWTDFVEVNINNLAAVPSIVFGLLGLAVFLSLFGIPRSAPLAGGLVLALMTLPTIIIASRSALMAVPPSIREAALGVGASPLQVVVHHVLPLAIPGIMTGTIIGMARALGETAPLLMIGMVAFIVDVPGSVLEPSTVLPVQIFLWADSPERAFVEKTSGAILVLLAFLIAMNLLAVLVRSRFERRW